MKGRTPVLCTAGRYARVVTSASLLGIADPALSQTAQAASSAPAAEPHLLFRSGAGETPFPWAGAAMLLVMLGIAAGTWWMASRRGLQPSRGLFSAGGRFALLRSEATATGSLRIVDRTRLDVSARLYVVEWQREQVLVALNGTNAPVVLSRRDVATTIGREPS